MHDPIKLTLWETLTLAGAASRSFATLLATAITGVFRGPTGASTYKNHVLFSASRCFSANTTIRHGQALSALTIDVYKSFAKIKGFETEIVDIGDSTRGCWIGSNSATTVIVWFHGGGYANSALNAHMEYIWNLVETGQKEGKSVAAFVLQYDTTPHAPYPRQLIQAVNVMRYLIEVEKRSPTNLYVGGDSAGAHLTLGVLSHIQHNHAQVVPLSLHGDRFKGVFLVSPAVTWDQSAPSFTRNAKKDILDKSTLRLWEEAFMGGASKDNFTTPLNAASDWWKELPAGRILLIAGEDEVFVDDIETFSKTLKINNRVPVDLHVGQGEYHDACIMNLMMGGGHTQSGERLKNWLLELYGADSSNV